VKVYFDTSAVVPLLVDEPGSELARRLWMEANRLTSAIVMPVEARAALARARRIGRLGHEDVSALVPALDELCAQVDRIVIDDALVCRAGTLADVHDLRGYDAIHLAACERVVEDETVLVTGDRELAVAAEALGVSTAVLPDADP
jgi:uncharacterized protein